MRGVEARGLAMSWVSGFGCEAFVSLGSSPN